jgi:hypothetical protein
MTVYTGVQSEQKLCMKARALARLVVRRGITNGRWVRCEAWREEKAIWLLRNQKCETMLPSGFYGKRSSRTC